MNDDRSPSTAVEILLVVSSATQSIVLDGVSDSSKTNTKIVIRSIAGLERALESISNHRFDLVLLDFGSRREAGTAAIIRILEFDSKLPIVYLVETEDESFEADAIDAGAIDCVVRDRLSVPVVRRLIRQVEERRRMFAKVEDLQAQLASAQKIMTMGILAGGAAHDFNNLLTVILSLGDLLAQRLTGTRELRHAVLIKKAQ